jgi:hypothetical protein
MQTAAGYEHVGCHGDKDSYRGTVWCGVWLLVFQGNILLPVCLQPCPVCSSAVSVPIIHLPEYTVSSARKSENKILVYLPYYFCTYEYMAICMFLYK